MLQNLQSFKEIFLNFLFPLTCLFCGSGKKIICEKCFLQIPTSTKDKNNILSVYKYREPKVNKLLWNLKYKHTHDVAEVFGKNLAENFVKWFGDFFDIGQIFLIPVPLNQGDKRLHNHANLIAKEISKNLKILIQGSNLEILVLDKMLLKNSHKKQAHSGRKKNRIENIENTITINAPYSPPSQERASGSPTNNLYVIVDDVTTTGATILNIRNVLSEFLNIPEENILGLTVAH